MGVGLLPRRSVGGLGLGVEVGVGLLVGGSHTLGGGLSLGLLLGVVRLGGLDLVLGVLPHLGVVEVAAGLAVERGDDVIAEVDLRSLGGVHRVEGVLLGLVSLLLVILSLLDEVCAFVVALVAVGHLGDPH